MMKPSVGLCLLQFVTEQQSRFLVFAEESYDAVTQAFIKEDVRTLNKMGKILNDRKNMLKSVRRKETLCLRRISRETAIEKSVMVSSRAITAACRYCITLAV